MLSVHNLSVRYGQPVFSNLNMQFNRRIYGIQGRSGSGKSTLIKAILGLIPYSGSVCYNGRELKRAKDRTGFQVIFQNPFYSFNPQKRISSAFEEMFRWNKIIDKDAVLSRCLDMISLSGSVLRKYPHECSGGELQRLSIARALSGNPQVLLLDEPTSALDVITQKKLLDDLCPLLTDKTVLFISHDRRVLNYCADEIIDFGN